MFYQTKFIPCQLYSTQRNVEGYPQFPFYGEGAADFDIDRFHRQFRLQQIALDSCPKVQYMQTIQLDLLCQL